MFATNFKPRPHLLAKRERMAEKASVDRSENAKVKSRSGGRCEVRAKDGIVYRCARRAGHVHHLISGLGRRNIGISLLAAHKLHVCEKCHAEIHGHVLTPTNEATRYDAATVKYQRIS